MGKRITLLFTEEEWNFIYNLQTIAFIASYRNPSAAPISDILKAMINDRYYTPTPERPDSELLKKIREEMKHDVDEERSRLGKLGYSKGNYVLNLSDYELESLNIHIKKREGNGKSKITESKMVKILVRENMEKLAYSMNLASNIYIGVLFGIGADGFVLLNNMYQDFLEQLMEKPKLEGGYDIVIPGGNWFIETSKSIKKDMPIVMDFFKLMKERGFPKDFNSYMEERKKYWSIVSYFNYMTAAAGYITASRILIYPTSWIPDFIYGSFFERFPLLSDAANSAFLLSIYQLMRYTLWGSYLYGEEEYKKVKMNWPKDDLTKDKFTKESQNLDELYKAFEEYNKKKHW